MKKTTLKVVFFFLLLEKRRRPRILREKFAMKKLHHSAYHLYAFRLTVGADKSAPNFSFSFCIRFSAQENDIFGKTDELHHPAYRYAVRSTTPSDNPFGFSFSVLFSFFLV